MMPTQLTPGHAAKEFLAETKRRYYSGQATQQELYAAADAYIHQIALYRASLPAARRQRLKVPVRAQVLR